MDARTEEHAMPTDEPRETICGIALATLTDDSRSAFKGAFLRTRALAVRAAREQQNARTFAGGYSVHKKRAQRDADIAHVEHLAAVLDQAFVWRGPFGSTHGAIILHLHELACSLA